MTRRTTRNSRAEVHWGPWALHSPKQSCGRQMNHSQNKIRSRLELSARHGPAEMKTLSYHNFGGRVMELSAIDTSLNLVQKFS